ncbi:MAG: TIM barrel protein [Planctomycetota bacterium]
MRTEQLPHPTNTLSRREACAMLGSAATSFALSFAHADDAPSAYRLKYQLASAMYGTFALDAILPEVQKTGATAIDIWRKPHGDQREQLEAMGVPAFQALLKKHAVTVGTLTCYATGPFKLQADFALAKQLNAKVIVCGSDKEANEPTGQAARDAVVKFLEKMKPHAEAAAAAGVRIAIENHSAQMLFTPDSMRYFAELNTSPNLGIAFAPHHLSKWPGEIAKLVADMGPSLAFFYAQEHGKGFIGKLPKNEEMMQMPGFGGGLDYKPVVAALKKLNYQGFVEILMHPTPRGIPILPTIEEVTTAINKSRTYLDECLKG